MFDLHANHADFVIAAYALLAVFVLGFGVHGWRCWVQAKKQDKK